MKNITSNSSTNIWTTNPKERGITVIGGLTGLGDMTQTELDKNINSIKKALINNAQDNLADTTTN